MIAIFFLMTFFNIYLVPYLFIDYIEIFTLKYLIPFINFINKCKNNKRIININILPDDIEDKTDNVEDKDLLNNNDLLNVLNIFDKNLLFYTMIQNIDLGKDDEDNEVNDEDDEDNEVNDEDDEDDNDLNEENEEDDEDDNDLNEDNEDDNDLNEDNEVNDTLNEVSRVLETKYISDIYIDEVTESSDETEDENDADNEEESEISNEKENDADNEEENDADNEEENDADNEEESENYNDLKELIVILDKNENTEDIDTNSDIIIVENIE